MFIHARSMFSLLALLAGAAVWVHRTAAHEGTLSTAPVIAIGESIPADPVGIPQPPPPAWCLTPTAHEGVAGGMCPTAGPCDLATIRESYTPLSDAPIMTVRIKFNVFANDNGSNPVESPASVVAQFNQLNADYLPSRIQFAQQTQFINSTQYRSFQGNEEFAMKTTYADQPDRQLNVYVVDNGGYGVGTFPWNPIALGPLGGIIIDDDLFGSGEHIMAHEVGHCLGLWHTHHGVSEVGACTPCYELADGSNGDTAGDFAADTAATPVNFQCGPPGGADCESTPFEETSPQNYMSYAPNFCYTEFSPDQWGRMNCWTRYGVQGWIVDCNANSVDDMTDVADGTSEDCDDNSFPDECQLDCTGNGVPDNCDFDNGTVTDCDDNGNPDECDADFDGDGAPDACDDDIDNDGVANGADSCDFTPLGAAITPNGASLGDTDGDCDLDAVDYVRFRGCFNTGGPNSNASNFCANLFDVDVDDNIDLFDFAALQIGFTGPIGD